MTKKLAFLSCLALALGLAGSRPVSGATLDLRIATGADDVEESVADHGMDLTSSDLEFPYDTSVAPDNDQVIGLRWMVPVPQGAKITKAYLEIECDQVLLGTQPVNVIIQGQLSPNAAPFSSAAADLTSRPLTKAQVLWSIADYTAQDQKVQSPDLAAIIQEIVDQPDWVDGNALVLSVRDDKSNPSQGLRESESYDGEAGAAPLLHLEVSIPQATKPDPANGATGVTMPMLQWTPGDSAVSHNIYFGTSPELGAADLAMLGQPVALYFHALGIEPGVTYYWRVDEVDAAGVVYPGTVWSFTALPLTAWAPQPADDANDLPPSQTLSWSAGQNATQHQVFFSDNKFDVILGAAAADKGATAETTLATGSLALKTTYYWRVDEIQADGKALPGPVWSFTTADVLELRIASGTDDAEEHLVENPRIDMTSSDLEMPNEDWSSSTSMSTDPQLIGMRWQVPLAKGTVATKAYIEFLLSETKGNMNPVNLIIEGQLDPNAATFTTTAKDISDRPRTKAQVKWTVPTGLAVLDKFQTPDLSPIINELLSQDGWASGNGLVLMVRDDPDNPSTGIRNAESFNTVNGTRAPLLHVEVAGDQAAAPKATIMWVSDAYDDKPDAIRDDQGWIDFLTSQGYNVDYRMGPALGNGFWRTLDQAKIDALNAADLVIVSRNTDSGSYDDGDEIAQWNSVQTPLLLMSSHIVRNSRWNWLNTGTVNSAVPLMKPADPAGPAFVGVTLDADGLVDAIVTGLDSSLMGIADVGNGTVLATRADTGELWIAQWEPGVEFYTGAGQIAGGPRVFFTGGAQEVVPAIGRGEFNLTDSGQAVFLNVVDMLLP